MNVKKLQDKCFENAANKAKQKRNETRFKLKSNASNLDERIGEKILDPSKMSPNTHI